MGKKMNLDKYRDEDEEDGIEDIPEPVPDYEELAVMNPERELESFEEDDDEGKHLSLGQALEASTDLTDMQFAYEKLFPPKLGTPVENALMIGDVSPEVFLPLLHGMTINGMMMSDPEKPLDFEMMKLKNYILLSIGLDRKGRIDAAELQGAARENRMAERSTGLGF